MYDEPRLSEAEWKLIVELLERERGELPAEIHHCQNTRIRTQLHQRSELVQGLLGRLKTPAAESLRVP